MLQMVLFFWLILFVRLSCGKPTSLRQNDGNGKFGYDYQVFHQPGSSTVHLNFKGNDNDHQKAFYNPQGGNRNSQSRQSLLHESYSLTHSEPNGYPTEVNQKPFAKSELPIYEPVTSQESRESYRSPYDSDRKQNSNGYGIQDNVYEPRHYKTESSQSLNIPENDYSSYEAPQHRYSNENYQPKQTALEDSYNPSYISQKTAESSPYFSGSGYENKFVNRAPNSNQDIHADNPSYLTQYEDVLPSESPAQNYGHEVSHSSPISQHDIDTTLNSPDPNFALSGFRSVPRLQSTADITSNTPNSKYALQPHYSGAISQQDIALPQKSIETTYAENPQQISDKPLLLSNKPLNEPNKHFNGVSNDAFESDTTGSKYVLVPSGPPYTRDTFTAEIIHGSQNGIAKPVLGHSNHNLEKESGHSPVSHAFRLPSVSSFSAGLNHEKTPLHSQVNDELIHVPPISHSTRIFIPNTFSSSVGEKISSVSEESPIFSEKAHLTDGAVLREQPPVHPISLESKDVGASHLDSAPQNSPITHSYRLTPGVLSDVSESKTGENFIPSHSDSSTNKFVSGIPPASHSFRLILPNVTPGVLPEVPQDDVSGFHGNSGFQEIETPFVTTTSHPDKPSALDPPTNNPGDNIQPASHSFRLILPNVLPEGPHGSIDSLEVVTSPYPVSHSVRLSWPPTFPDEQAFVTSKVDYLDNESQLDNFKSSDSTLLALETKTEVR